MGLKGEELMAYSIWLIARSSGFHLSYKPFAIRYMLLEQV